MKILQICHKPPYPAIDGGCIAINNISRGLLNQKQDLKIITISTSKHPFFPKKIESNFKGKTKIEHVFVDTKLNIVDAFSNLVTYDSYNISRFFSPDFDQLVIKTLQSGNFDIVHLESLFTTPYLETIRNHSDAKIVLRSHNLEYMIWERLASETNNPAKKIYLNLLSNQLKNYEIEIVSKIDGIAAISKEDKKKYIKLGCKVPLKTIPFGIDSKTYKPKNKKIDIQNLSFFHLGAMNWKPNLEAVGWLNKDIWPTIASSFPNFKLHLAGKNMPQWIINNNNLGIINHQEVESAIDFMNEYDIMLVPLLSAGGIRVKIIEGMALGKVIISTKIGAEGIDYKEGVNILIANSAQEFRAKIKWLTSHPEKIREIGENAKNYISEQYDNSIISKKLVQFYNSL
jgi:polysaccharide biosynthesis protein PslH